MLGKEAEGDSVACLLIIHAEDQLMSAEGFKLIALCWKCVQLYFQVR